MRRLLILLAAAVVVAAPAASVSAKNGHGVLCVLHARLSAANEPSSTSTAFGQTLIKVRQNGTITYRTHINNPAHETFTAGHIHVSPTGSVVVPLFVPPAPSTSAGVINQSGTATPNAGTTGAALCQNPSTYYVNYHTPTNPAGAIRGTLH